MFTSWVSLAGHNHPLVRRALSTMIRRFITNSNIKQQCQRSISSAMEKLQEIPSPMGLPVVGTTLALIAAGGAPKLHIYIDERHKQLGPIFRDKIGPIQAVFVSDAECMRKTFSQEGKYPKHMLPEGWTVYNQMYGCSRGLFFMDGEEWLQYRKIMNKLLLKGDLGLIESACEVVSEQLVNKLQDLIKHSEVVPDLESELYRWSLNVLVSILMGPQCFKCFQDQLSHGLNDLASTVHLIFQKSVALQILPASLAAKLNLGVWKSFVEVVSEALKKANDLVECLLDDFPLEDGLLRKMEQENVPRSMIVRIVADLILAAGESNLFFC